MQKKLALVIIVVLLISGGFTQIYAEDTGVRGVEVQSDTSFIECRSLLLENNQILKDLGREIERSFKQYRDILYNSKNIEVEGTGFKIELPPPFRTEYHYFKFDQYTQMLLLKQKELLPRQLKSMWVIARDRLGITENTLTTGLRNIYMATLAAEGNYKLELRKFDAEKELYEQQKLSYSKGLLSEIDAEEGELNYLSAQKSLQASQRNRENAVRVLNSYIGMPLDRDYSGFLSEDAMNGFQYELDTYIYTALKKRIEITGLKEQIRLREAEMEIMERNTVHERYEEAEKAYGDLLVDLDSLNLQLEMAELDVEKEIADAYVDVINTGKNVESLEKTLILQKKNLEFYRQRYEHGFISKAVLDRIEMSVYEIENGYRLALFDYNTRHKMFMDASGLGPAY